MATARIARWWMLVYTIAIGLLMILVMVHGSHKVAQHNPITEALSSLAVVLMFAGNLLYTVGYITPFLRKGWKFVFAFILASFVMSAVQSFSLDKYEHPVGPIIRILAIIIAIVLFFPSFRANFLLGYGDVDRVKTIEPPVIMSEDPLRDLVGEIKKLRRTTQTAWIVAILLLTTLVLITFFQLHFERKDDSWVTVRRLADSAHYEEALTVAHRLVDKDPDSPQTRILLGTLQLSLGRLHEAEASFTRAYELLPAESIANMLNAVRKRIDETGPTPTPTTSP